MARFENPWGKGGEFCPSYIRKEKDFAARNADYVLGKTRNAPMRIKNPKTEDWLTEQEIDYFRKLLGSKIGESPYEVLKLILERLTGVRFPELPSDARLAADWDLLFKTWFYEYITPFEDAVWVGNSKTIFNSNSLYCHDIPNSVSFSDTENPVCIKYQFFQLSDEKRPNPFTGSFSFIGSDSGRPDYYSWVEWFIGSYNCDIYWEKISETTYDLNCVVTNTSSWYSGTRLPKSWQDRIEDVAGVKIENLVDSAPRSETISRKLPYYVKETLEWMGINIPSFGGNWEQVFNISTQWES